MTEVESPCFLNTQNNYPTEELGKFMETLKGNSPVYQAYQRFFDTYKVNGTARTEQDYIEKLSTLQKNLDIIPKKKPKLEVCGAVASGKTFWAKIIMDILRKLGGNVRRDTVENDISEDFDTRILSQLGYNRESDFFKQNLRNIGYATMRCFGENGCHAAPFSNGKQLTAIKEQEFADEDQGQCNPKRCPGIVIDTSGEQRMQHFVGRGAARDEGRVPYTAEISQGIKGHAGVFVVHNNGDLEETKKDILSFIKGNKAYYNISLDDTRIQKVINRVLLPTYIENLFEKKREELLKCFQQKISPSQQNSDYEKIEIESELQRNFNAWGFIESQLTGANISQEAIAQIQSDYYDSFFIPSHIDRNQTSFIPLISILSKHHIGQDIINRIMSILSSKNITKEEHKAYITAISNKQLFDTFPLFNSIQKRQRQIRREISSILYCHNPYKKTDQLVHEIAATFHQAKIKHKLF